MDVYDAAEHAFPEHERDYGGVGGVYGGFSSIFTGLNFIVTIHRMRAPGLTWFRLPLFVWAHYAAAIIMVLATPVVSITIVLVAVERLIGIGILIRSWVAIAAVSASVLVLFSSGGVCDAAAVDGCDFRGDCVL